jgi:hypothetical protein
MFLIRTAFWLTLIILLLQRAVYGTAEAAVNDVRTFCTRNPDVCEKSRDAFDVFTQKAKFGAQMLMDFATDASSDTGPDGRATDERRRLPVFFRDDSQNTLTVDDREPSWFGPSSKSGV